MDESVKIKRRSFLAMLGLAPAAPLYANELLKQAPPLEPAKVVETVHYQPPDSSLMYSMPYYCTVSAVSVVGVAWRPK